ncbi:MAG: hypothetical protein R2811_06890 [Flavobacteriales bacterium]
MGTPSVNKCRYANFFIKPDQAIGWGNKALSRYRKDKHRAKWKYAYTIYQALGTAHRNIHNGGDVLFAHFDTARTLLHHQPDLIPYWLANLHKAVSNAALDRMASGLYDPALFAPICDREQRAALGLLERYYPSQLAERSMRTSGHQHELPRTSIDLVKKDGEPDRSDTAASTKRCEHYGVAYVLALPVVRFR